MGLLTLGRESSGKVVGGNDCSVQSWRSQQRQAEGVKGKYDIGGVGELSQHHIVQAALAEL